VADPLADRPPHLDLVRGPHRGQPGYCATDLNGHRSFRAPEQGAAVVAQLATLPADGPDGVLWGHLWTADGPDEDGVLPW